MSTAPRTSPVPTIAAYAGEPRPVKPLSAVAAAFTTHSVLPPSVAA